MTESKPDTVEKIEIASFLRQQEQQTLLRFLTCGSVDDGKSTLIGRLLFDTKLIFEDQLAALERDSRKHGTTGKDIDFALLVDGLEAEREQGITIDVAYRFFSTPVRKFIVADTPGHEQYTRNMATGASTAELAVVLVDARKGVLTQTRRHSFICSLLGICNIVLAVNKIDLVNHDKEIFENIVSDYEELASAFGFQSVVAIPMSARYGDNVTFKSGNIPWYDGPTLLRHLETVSVLANGSDLPFRLPVQYVSRPNQEFRGFAGTVASGSVSVGDTVVVAQSGRSSTVKRIASHPEDLQTTREGQAVILELNDDIDVSRGNLLVQQDRRPEVADQFNADIVWFDDHHLMPGRTYVLRTETDSSTASITALKYKTDVNTFVHETGRTLEMNELGNCNVATQHRIAFDAYDDNHATGAFVLIDRMTNATAGAGIIRHPLRRASNVHLQALDISKPIRAEHKHQKPVVLWFTGLSGSGKSTISNAVEKRLFALGKHTYALDGDNVRHGLNRDLGFTETDRVENIRRVGEVARLMIDAGLIVLVSFISPFAAERRSARALLEDGEFVEVFVDTPLNECIRRDPKGLYAKAQRGEIFNFTGIDSPYEPPEQPEIHMRTSTREVDDLADEVETWLRQKSII